MRCLVPLLAVLPAGAMADEIAVLPGDHLRAALIRAEPGDTLVLRPGVHDGPIVVDRPVTLQGEPGAVVAGAGKGSVVTIAAPGVTVRGLILRGSGDDVPGMDSGVFLGRDADRARVEDNRIEGNLFGVYVWGPEDALVTGNVIQGRTGGRRAETGNGVTVWNSPGSRVVGNAIRDGRDGIFSNTSRRNVFHGNRLEGTRFAIHYMYTNDSEVSGNVSVGNHGGYAIMFSNRLVVRDNLSQGDRDHGLLLNAANASVIEGNRVDGRFPPGLPPWGTFSGEAGGHTPAAGEEASAGATAKCVFIYNANKNRFRENRFQDCGIGVHFTAGSEGNAMSGNAFINNRTQVKYVGTRSLDWSAEGRGNYWSDNPAFDLNADGFADEPYRPNDVVDRVMWSAPAAKLLLNSPGVQVVRWAQKRFPAIAPGGVVDSRPLMRPPGREEARR